MSDSLFWINLNEGRLWRFRGAVAETPLSRVSPRKSFYLHIFNDCRDALQGPTRHSDARRRRPRTSIALANAGPAARPAEGNGIGNHLIGPIRTGRIRSPAAMPARIRPQGTRSSIDQERLQPIIGRERAPTAPASGCPPSSAPTGSHDTLVPSACEALKRRTARSACHPRLIGAFRRWMSRRPRA